MVNRVGGRMGSHICLDPKYLLERARRETGLEDFGGGQFETPLGVLVDSWETEARFNLVGRLLAQRELLHCLANRLRIEEYFRRNPATAGIPVPDLVIITGAPRTGTTLLHRLLAADSSNRTLRMWELVAPVPAGYTLPPGDDPRLAAVARGLSVHRALLLSAEGREILRATHHSEAGDPEECIRLLDTSFLCEAFGLSARSDSYMVWLRSQDWTPVFRYHRKQIQLLTAARPASRLILKHPGHLGYLDDMLQVYPNARVLWLHRDPVEVVASCCNLCAVARAIKTDSVDLEHIGLSVVNSTLWRFDRGMRARERQAPDRFLDVQYLDLIRDPMATAARIYEWLGFPLTAEAKEAFTGYLQRNQRERGRYLHDYTLETFGLDAASLRPKFHDYCERFQVGSASVA
jgi:hypothetical protein